MVENVEIQYYNAIDAYTKDISDFYKQNKDKDIKKLAEEAANKFTVQVGSPPDVSDDIKSGFLEFWWKFVEYRKNKLNEETKKIKIDDKNILENIQYLEKVLDKNILLETKYIQKNVEWYNERYLPEVKKKIEELENSINKIDESYQDFSTKAKEINDLYGGIEKKLGEISKYATSLPSSEQINSLRSSVKSLETLVENVEEIEKLDKRVEKLGKNFGKLKQGYESAANRVNKIEEEYSKVKTNIDNLGKSLENTQRDLEDYAKKVNEYNEEIKSPKKRKLLKKIKKAKKEFDKTMNKYTKIKSEIDGIEKGEKINADQYISFLKDYNRTMKQTYDLYKQKSDLERQLMKLIYKNTEMSQLTDGKTTFGYKLGAGLAVTTITLGALWYFNPPAVSMIYTGKGALTDLYYFRDGFKLAGLTTGVLSALSVVGNWVYNRIVESIHGSKKEEESNENRKKIWKNVKNKLFRWKQ